MLSDDMLQLTNESPFRSTMAILPDPNGVDTLYIVIKGTLDLGTNLQIADTPEEVQLVEEFHEEPGSSSLKFPTDVLPSKPGTDVLLLGNAYPERGSKDSHADIRVRVADRTKAIRVFGNRRWEKGVFGMKISEPEPFSAIPLIFENAFGGINPEPLEDGYFEAETRNPLGKGFLGARKPKTIDGAALPNLENPAELIEKPGQTPVPVCFGPVAASWEPRLGYAGTYDEAWNKGRSPYLPEDFDPRFFMTATPELQFSQPLQGGEPILMEGLTKSGRPIRSSIPRCNHELFLTCSGNTEALPLNLETVILEPEENRMLATWKAAYPCDKKALKIESIRYRLLSLDVS